MTCATFRNIGIAENVMHSKGEHHENVSAVLLEDWQ